MTKQQLSARALKAWQTRRNNQQTVIANQQFNRLPTADQRVAIAHDIVGSIQAKQYVPTMACWFRFNNTPPGLEEGMPLQPILMSRTAGCVVCAIGACFASAVRLGNECTVDHWMNKHASSTFKESLMSGVLHRYFTIEQMTLIEAAFELGYGDIKLLYIDAVPLDQHALARIFGQQYSEPADRLLAIAKNIIENKGEFVPKITIDVYPA